MKEKLCPNCSEYINKLGIKKEEIPYIKKRVNELFSDKDDRKYFLKEFTDLLDKQDIMHDFISEDYVAHYDKISNELMTKRNQKFCPFCKEVKEDMSSHIKSEHIEEVKSVLKHIEQEEYERLKKEITVDNL